jgi:cardiolipin synthase
MLADCAQAKSSIDFEQFILLNDEIGSAFFELFIAKAKAGVKVRLICDAAGSYGFYNSSLPAKLRQEGIEVRFYNPIQPWRMRNVTSWFFRDHRKLLVVDSSIGFTGGVGVEKKLAGWKDTHVRLTGMVVREMQYAFEKMWQTMEDGRYRPLRFGQFGQNDIHFLTNGPHFRQRFYYRRLMNAIRTAKDYIYLTTPYFVPSQHFLIRLKQAARRGVDVRLIVPKKSDHDLVDTASKVHFGTCMRSGIKIYQFRNGMIHTKSAIVDDRWAAVGSSNLDNLSLLFNYEANLVVENKLFISELKQYFIDDILNCDLIDPLEWAKRPMHQRFWEWCSLPFHGLL